jgi:hypothetical protein
VVDVVGSEDKEQGDGGYGYFAYGSYDEGAGSLLEEVFEVGEEAYSGEDEEEGPAARRESNRLVWLKRYYVSRYEKR